MMKFDLVFAIVIGVSIFALGGNVIAQVIDAAVFLVLLCFGGVALAMLGTGAFYGVQWWLNWQIERQERLAEIAKTQAEVSQVQAETQLVRAENGLFPVSIEAIRNPQWAMMALQSAAIFHDSQRTHPNVPNTFTYRPQMSHANNISAISDIEQSETQPFEEWVTPPFQVLYQQNAFPTNGEILLGFSDYGDRLLTKLSKFAAVIIAGASGKGKSSLFRYCLLQHMMYAQEGLDLLMCDPHAHAGDDSLAHSLAPLRHMFLGDVASDERDILSAAQYCVEVGQRRVDGDGGRKPLMLVIDEISLLLDGSDIADELGHCLKRIGREFRKVSVMAVVIGQQFGSNVMDTGVRNSFTRVLACPNIRDNVGHMLPSSAAKQVEEIRVGQFVDYEIGAGTQVVNFPDTTRQDVEIVAASKLLPR